jgi:hypothetical protein
MKKSFLIVSLLLCSVNSALADGVSRDVIFDLSADMFRAYENGGVTLMLNKDRSCWDRVGKKDKTAAVTCTLRSVSGAFIEATYANQQRRGAVPEYNGNLFRKRLLAHMDKVGFSEGEAQQLMDSFVVPKQDDILSGLIRAGMN